MRLLASVVGIMVLLVSSLPAQQQITWRKELPPLKMSFKDLEKIARRVIDTVGENGRHSLEIQSGEQTLSFKEKGILQLATAQLPELAENVDYLYFAGDDSDPITLVSIHFSNSSRDLKVQGNSPSESEKLFRVILSDLDGLTTVGGVGEALGVVVAIGLITAALIYYLRHYFTDISPWYLGVFAAASVTLILGPLWQPRLLPGFAIFSGEVAWYRRYGLELGLVLALLGIALSGAPKLFMRLKANSGPPQETDGKNET